MLEFKEKDKISEDFEEFVNDIDDFLSEHPSIVCKKEIDAVHFLILNDLQVFVRVSVFKNFNVKAYKFNTLVSVRSLLDYQCKLRQWSQLEAVLNTVKQSNIDFNTELVWHSGQLRSHLESCDSCDPKIMFLVNQFEYISKKKRGSAYSAQELLQAAQIYLSSRAGYKSCRLLLTLPSPSTLKRHIGGLQSGESLEECHDIIAANLEPLLDIQKNVVVIFDEVYVKASVRYRGCHVVGRAIDNPEETARTILAIMVHPLAGGKAFMVRLIPVYSLCPEFLTEQLKAVIKVLQNCGAKICALISDNHPTNRRCYSLFQGQYDIVGTFFFFFCL